MATAKKGMERMTTRELKFLKSEIASRIREQIRTGGPVEEMVWFEQRIDNELNRRGA